MIFLHPLRQPPCICLSITEGRSINFCPVFVTDEDYNAADYVEHSKLADIVRHVMHLYNVGGSDFVTIGKVTNSFAIVKNGSHKRCGFIACE